MLTFEKIREMQLGEKSETLQHLPEGFIDDVAEYLKSKQDSEEGRTAQKLIINLFERRLRKLVNLAALYYLTERVPENITKDEEKFYFEIVSILRKQDSFFREKILLSAKNDEKPTSCSHEVHTKEEKVEVFFIQDTPELISPDMEKCVFKKGDCVKLNAQFANFLEKKGFCKIST